MERPELTQDELLILSIIRKLSDEYARYGRHFNSTEVLLSVNEKEFLLDFEQVIEIIDSLVEKRYITREIPGGGLYLI